MMRRLKMQVECPKGHEVWLVWEQADWGANPIPPTEELERDEENWVAIRACPECGEQAKSGAMSLRALWS